MNRAVAEPPLSGSDKGDAILSAALRLIGRCGLHNTPMSAIGQEV